MFLLLITICSACTWFRYVCFGYAVGFRGKDAAYQHVWRCSLFPFFPVQVFLPTSTMPFYCSFALFKKNPQGLSPPVTANSRSLCVLVVQSLRVPRSVCHGRTNRRICQAVEERLWGLPFAPRFSFGRRMLREDGTPNRLFRTYLFCDGAIATTFLKDVGLLRSKVQCNICGRYMTWSAEPKLSEGFRWRCRRSVAGTRCRVSASIRHGSWFQKCYLTLQEILLVTYEIVCHEPASKIQNE